MIFEFSNVLLVFLHVGSASLGAILWVIAFLLVICMTHNKRFDLVKRTSVLFLVGGILFVFMQFLGATAYPKYFNIIAPMGSSLADLDYLFKLKLFANGLGSLTGFIAAGGSLVTDSKGKAYFTLVMTSVTLGLVVLCAVLSVMVMSNVSI